MGNSNSAPAAQLTFGFPLDTKADVPVLPPFAALGLGPGVGAASAQPRPSGGAISSEEPTKATDTTAPEGEDTRRHPTGKKEEGQRPTMLYVKNHHPAGILTDVHVHMPRKVSEPPNADP